MINVYDLAHQLARGLRESRENQDFRRAKERVAVNETTMQMIRDIRARQIELQALQMAGKEPDKEKEAQLEKLYDLLTYHPAAKEYLEAEYRLARLLGDVTRIIGEAVDMGTDPAEISEG